MSDLKAALAEHFRLCHEAAGATALMADLIGACAEHPSQIDSTCEGCQGAYSVAVRRSQLLQRAGLAREQINLLESAAHSQTQLEALDAPAAPRRHWWQRRREVGAEK